MTVINGVRKSTVFIAVLVGVYMLQWGKDFLMPLVLAMLLAHVLTPAVRWLCNHRIPNASAVTIVTLVPAGIVVVGILLLSQQLLSLTSQVPNYRDNIIAKVKALHESADGPISRLMGVFGDVKREFNPPTSQATTAPVDPTRPTTTQPMPVEIVIPRTDSAMSAVTMLTPILTPLANVGIVFGLMFFFLFERDLIAHRLRWLMRQGDVSVSSDAIDDAASRVSRYLRMQLLVNACYGILVAVSLWLIGLPNVILLGAVGATLRYIPYIGPLIGIALPTAMSIAIFPEWTSPLLVLGVLLVIEVVTNMVLEPLLYGSSTGVSSTGVVLASFFWGWTWGAMGLIMAMPLTVWIVIVGRNLPGVRQLAIVLSADDCVPIEAQNTPPEEQKGSES